MNTSRKTTLFLLLAAGILFHTVSAMCATNIIHRWSFNETSGTTVADSVGGKNGTLKQIVTNSVPVGSLPTLDGTAVTLDGQGGYVDLGNGIFSGLSNMTIEVWFRFLDNSAAANWANLICAGSITNTSAAGQGGLEDTDGTLRNINLASGQYLGTREFFIAPRNGANGNGRFAITDSGTAGFNAERPVLDSDDPLPGDAELGGFDMHLAVTYSTNGARLFLFGDEESSGAPTNMVPLSAVEDVNIWLGRSLYGGDPMLSAAIDELRVHDTILTGPELTASYFAGATDPNIVGYDPGALSALDGSTTINPVMSQTATQPLRVMGTFANLGAIPISFLDLDYAFVSDTNVLELSNGFILAKQDGSSTVFFGLDGISNSVNITVSTVAPVLVHRYSFSETTGTTLTDSESGTNAAIVVLSGGGQTSGSGGHALGGGQLRLYGGGKAASDYIDLADNIFSANSLSNVSIEIWASQHSAQNWSRLFDFGSSTADSWFLSFSRGGNINQQRFAHIGRFADQDSNIPTSLDQMYHYVAVYGGGRAAWYRDGALIAEATGLTSSPLDLNATNNWLGRSQFNDNAPDASFDEVRVWNGTLLPLNIALNAAAGPDTIPPNPGQLLSITVEAEDLLLGDPIPSPAILSGTFENISNVNLVTVGGSISSGDPAVITVDANGNLTGVGAAGESATISGTYFSESVTPTVVTILGPTSVALNLSATSFVEGSAPADLTLVADFSGQPGVDVSSFNGVDVSSTDETVAALTADGRVAPIGPGTAWIAASYGGFSVSNQVTVSLSPAYATPSVTHRYSFNADSTTTAVDSVGGADGTLVNGTTAGAPAISGGQLVLNNVGFTDNSAAANYLSLPANILPTSGSVTIEQWHMFAGSGFNCKGWAFSDRDGTNNVPNATNGQYFAFNVSNPQGGPNPPGGGSQMQYSLAGFNATQRAWSTTPGLGAGGGGYLDDGVAYYSAAVVDANAGTLKYYIYRISNGVGGLQDGVTGIDLGSFNPVEAYIGRSMVDGDPAIAGSVDEFRIWNGALIGADIAASFAAGPNSLITPTVGVSRPELNITAAVPNVILSWSTNNSGFNLQVAPEVTGAYTTNGLPSPTVVGDKYQVTVPATEDSEYFRLSE